MDCCIVGWKRRLSRTGLSLYAELELSKTASDREINLCYRKLALKYHPDKNPGDDVAAEKFKEINRIHKILTDPKKRSIYDEYGSFGLFIAEEYGDDEVGMYSLLSSTWFQIVTVLTCCCFCFCCFCCCNGCCGLCCKDANTDDQEGVPNLDDLNHRSIEDIQRNNYGQPIVIQPQASSSSSSSSRKRY